jgi:hypothetical protein
MKRANGTRFAHARTHARTHNPSQRMVLTVELTKRQEQQLVAVSDELGLPFHQVGERAIVAFLEASGHHGRGRMARSARRR